MSGNRLALAVSESKRRGETRTGVSELWPWSVIDEWVLAAHHRALERGDVPEPAAIALATVDADGAPDVRTVLCRDVSPQGLRLFTSLVSAKAGQIAADPRVAVTWTWPSMFRALRFRGVAEELPRDQVDEYFRQRPWGARIGAHVSRQSHAMATRQELVDRQAELTTRWPDRSRPDDVSSGLLSDSPASSPPAGRPASLSRCSEACTPRRPSSSRS